MSAFGGESADGGVSAVRGILSGSSPDEVIGVVFIHADFAAAQCAQMESVCDLLSKKHANVRFAKLDAEAEVEEGNPVDSLLERVEVVPTILFYKKGKQLAKVAGADAAAVSSTLEKLVKESGSPSSLSPALKLRLQKLIGGSPVMVFMKGDREKPRCKFSRALIEIMQGTGIGYGTFDILEDNDVRQGLKVYINHKTFPQVYVEQRFIGGLDDIKSILEKKAGGDPKALGKFILEASAKRAAASAAPAKKTASKGDVNSRIDNIIGSSKVMLFMKGEPGQPKCGFSSKIVGILNGAGIAYATFDILEDNEVRQGIKKYKNWPTFPQLYVDGELVGGLDIVQEMAEEGDLKEELGL